MATVKIPRKTQQKRLRKGRKPLPAGPFCSVRPQRLKPRPYNERDAARIMCYVTQDGGNYELIEANYREICQDAPRRRNNTSAEAAMEFGAMQLENSNEQLNDAMITFKLINVLIDVLLQLIPLLKPIKILERFLKIFSFIKRVEDVMRKFRGPGIVTAKIEVINRQVAANDSAIRILRQAAANDARFRQQQAANDARFQRAANE